jgi:hypothetical protein
LKRQLSVAEIRKGLSDKPLYRQELAKIGRGQLPFQG